MQTLSSANLTCMLSLSTSDGVVKKVCVEDGQPVEYGQTIIVLE